jgi:hypothetical protein
MLVLISIHVGIEDNSQQFKNHIRLTKWPEISEQLISVCSERVREIVTYSVHCSLGDV